MKCFFLVIASVLGCTLCFSQSNDEKEILRLLNNQTVQWNKGDIDGFMEGYWNNDSLTFIGKSGITYGFESTLQNYKKTYSDTIKMGRLHFDIIKVQQLSPEYFFVVGKWLLRRSIGDLSGHYTLLFRKIDGEWVIVSDHSS